MKKPARVDSSTMEFLRKLKKNNNRDWFNARKDVYLTAKENIEAFVDSLISKLNTHDRIETESGKKSLYRIYNDVRFSKDKTPYTCKFSGHLKRHKPELRGGYYFSIKPNGTTISCGFAYPDPDDLKRIRLDIADNYSEWNKMLRARPIHKYFGEMTGDRVRTAPRGFEKDHPAIELLKYRQFWFSRSFSDEQVIAPDFLNEINNTYKSIRPFFDYMSEVLTTDLNGESII